MYSCSSRYRRGSWMPMPFRMMYGMMCSAAEYERRRETARRDIIDTAAATGGFETWLAAVRVAGLMETLRAEGPLTVFVPDNEAFSELTAGASDDLFSPDNRERLRQVLGNHVAPGRFTSADIVRQKHVKTLNGDELKLAVDIRDQYGPQVRGVLTIDKVPIIRTDIECTNGVIHIVSRVLMPRTQTV